MPKKKLGKKKRSLLDYPYCCFCGGTEPSKALWLCYPYDVPIFDSFAQRALRVIAKLETRGRAVIVDGSEYRRFLHIWKALYDCYAVVLSEIETHGYPYQVRIFDKILWMIGTRDYAYRT